jgi:hypothetical protein
MKKMMFITTAKGGLGKTLFAHHCRLIETSLRYQLFFGERTPQRFPRTRSKRPSGIKITAFRRY